MKKDVVIWVVLLSLTAVVILGSIPLLGRKEVFRIFSETSIETIIAMGLLALLIGIASVFHKNKKNP